VASSVSDRLAGIGLTDSDDIDVCGLVQSQRPRLAERLSAQRTPERLVLVVDVSSHDATHTNDRITIILYSCDVYVGGKVRVSEFMIFLDLQHRGSK